MKGPKNVFAAVLLMLFLALPSHAQETAGQASDEGGWIGVTIRDNDPRFAQRFGLSETEGVVITRVYENSPAEQAGLVAGDVIEKVDGAEVENVREFIDRVRTTPAGDDVTLELSRNGKDDMVIVKLGQTPPGVRSQQMAQEMIAQAHQHRPEKGAAKGAAPTGVCPPDCPMMGDMGGMMGHGMMGGGMMGMCPRNCPCPMMGGMGAMMGGSMMGTPGACPDYSGKPMRPDWKYGKIFMQKLKGLDLTDEQKTKVKSLVSDYKKRTVRAKADIKVAEIELRELAYAQPVNLDRIKAKINELYAKKAELKFSRYRSLEDLKKILTPEQLQKLGMGEVMMGEAGEEEEAEFAGIEPFEEQAD